MGAEVDLLKRYPRTSRDLEARDSLKSAESRRIARQFGREYFDGDRSHGYGGFTYHPRFWGQVVPDIVSHFGLTGDSTVLDVGCAKGFLVHDLLLALPGATVKGIDISDYAITNSLPEVRDQVAVGNATDLPFEDGSFDVVLSINTIHNLPAADCKRALMEIERVSAGGAFVTVDAYRSDEERIRMEKWNLTAMTMMSTNEWESFFSEAGYSGDYYWFIP